MKRIWIFISSVVVLASVLTSCGKASVPKPYGYFRIDLPDTAYSYARLSCYPYDFRLSKNAYVAVREREGEMFWIDIQYPKLNVTIHCSYKRVNNNLRSLSRDAQEFLYGHSSVATAIPMQEYINPDHDTYGLYYELHGNTATPYQFYLTDSVKHFFRGSVYCNTIPNQDSLAPIYEYLRKDVRVMMESFCWQ